jgi:hypothetical protein
MGGGGPCRRGRYRDQDVAASPFLKARKRRNGSYLCFAPAVPLMSLDRDAALVQKVTVDAKSIRYVQLGIK